ncbi:SDR family NAD(P)-dependent oxidoreductase [Lichenicoccus sp.]|uniref:SDR family NAD(P)-dependent oxidoreductase n=1 Tax=Lichenicoccus sp. TaxID=2781899 RepID=UPI003D0D20B9
MSRSVLVTGAGSGIGRAIALALAPTCERLLLVGRGEAALREVAARAGHGTVLAADVATAKGRARIAEAALPGLDVLVCSAGAFLRRPLDGMAAEDWVAMDAVNVHAPILLAAACLPALRGAGSDIVIINSTSGLAVTQGAVAYAAGKHALRAATDGLRHEVRGQGIRVLSIFPGRTDTPMQAAILAEEGREAPPDALMAPEDVAAMVCAALALPRRAEVTELTLRPSRPL